LFFQIVHFDINSENRNSAASLRSYCL
jgi:hypothetical protein